MTRVQMAFVRKSASRPRCERLIFSRYNMNLQFKPIRHHLLKQISPKKKMSKILIFFGALALVTISTILFYPASESPQQTQLEVSEPQSETSESEQFQSITAEELSKHDSKGDCWITYEEKVYDYSDANLHPNMEKTFLSHCGQTTGFQEGATSKHESKTSESRVQNFGKYIGDLI